MNYSVFQPIEPLVALTYQAMMIETTQQAVEIAEAVQQATIAGKIKSGKFDMNAYPDGSLGWLVQITVDKKLFTAYQYDWLVQDSEGALSLWHGGSQWAGINPEFASKFPVPPVEWAATTTAPTATAQPGGTASLVFPQPTSFNAPFNYNVAQTIGGSTTEAALAGAPAVDSDGNVTLSVIGITPGDAATFTVTVTTPYAGVTAASLPTASITAIA